jgi:hypothetical protein
VVRLVLRPGAGRYVSDVAAHLLGLEDWSSAQDAVTRDGYLSQRRGWAFKGTQAVSANPVGLYEVAFTLNGNTRLVTTNASPAQMHVWQSSGAGIPVASSGSNYMDYSSTAVYLPRAVYRDELLVCAQDGESPMFRYSGSLKTWSSFTGTQTLAAGEAKVTGFTANVAPDRGGYLVAHASNLTGRVATYPRIVESGTTQLTLEDCHAGSTQNLVSQAPLEVGHTWPAVPVYDRGTVTVSSRTLTGYGTQWSSLTTYKNDAVMLIMSGGNAQIGSANFVGPSSDTSWSGIELSDQSTKSAYKIMRRCPFKDVAAHKGGLWGAGVKAYPNRVYYSPPDWNLAFPPGAVMPFDPIGDNTGDPAQYQLDWIDVPSPYHGDPIVAILSSPGPLWVLMHDSVHGVDGSWPDVYQRKIADGAGCLDIRSAISVEEGLFFAGVDGIYWSPNGEELVDITDGRIKNEWRALTSEWDPSTSYVSCGAASGHLLVSGKFGSTSRSLLFDLARREWLGKVSNVSARAQFVSRTPGKKPALYFVDSTNDVGRVKDFAPAVDGTGSAKDENGLGPSLSVHTTANLSGGPTLEESKLTDVEIHANVYDQGSPGSSQLTLALKHSGGQVSATKTLAPVNSDNQDLVDRYVRQVNRSGRLHQLQLGAVTGTNSTSTKIEVHEVSVTFRPTRRGT